MVFILRGIITNKAWLKKKHQIVKKRLLVWLAVQNAMATPKRVKVRSASDEKRLE